MLQTQKLLNNLEHLGIVSKGANRQQAIRDVIASLGMFFMILLVLLLSPYPFPWGIALTSGMDHVKPLFYKVLAAAIMPILFLILSIVVQKHRLKKQSVADTKIFAISTIFIVLLFVAIGCQTYFIVDFLLEK